MKESDEGVADETKGDFLINQQSHVEEPAKGVLFGNGYRLLPPEKREEQFTEKCRKTAEQQNISLIRTSDLFPLYQYLLIKDDKDFKSKCRKAIVDNFSGIVRFPEVPKPKKAK